MCSAAGARSRVRRWSSIMALVVSVVATVASLVGWRSSPPLHDALLRPPSAADYHSLLVAASDGPSILLATHRGVFRLADDSGHWRRSGLRGSDVVALARDQGGRLWAAGHLVLATSRNDGRTWSPRRPAGLPSLDVHALAAGAGRLYCLLADGRLYASADGRHFSPRQSGSLPDVAALAATATNVLFAADRSRGVLRLAPGQRRWRLLLRRQALSVALAGGRRIVAGTTRGVYVSTDAGRNWRRGKGVDAAVVAIVVRSPGPWLLLTATRRLYTSSHAGTSWQPAKIGAKHAHAVRRPAPSESLVALSSHGRGSVISPRRASAVG